MAHRASIDHRSTSAAAREEDPAGRTPYDLPLSANQITYILYEITRRRDLQLKQSRVKGGSGSLGVKIVLRHAKPL